MTRISSQGADGLWKADKIELPQPGIWTVVIGGALGPDNRLALDGPIVITHSR
jgi:hypothetical protein